LSGITKNKRSKNNLDHFMVIPLGAPEVADLVDPCFEPVVHCLRLLSFIEDELTEFSLDRFALGDLGHLVPFMRRLEDVPNFFGTFQPLHLVILLLTQGSEEYRGGLGIKVPYLGSLIGFIVLVAHMWWPTLQTQQYPIRFCRVRLDGASFYQSTYNNLHHQNMVVCLGVPKVKEHV
jgi:hypothetical protein